MGERDWHARYRYAREYADEQARRYENGDEMDRYRGITGAAWVAEAYSIAVQDAKAIVSVHGGFWQPLVDECERLAEEYRLKVSIT